MTSINKVIICGRVTDAGPKLTYASEGTPQCAFTLIVEEPGRDGAPFKLFVPVEVFGKQGQKRGRLGVMAWAVNLLQGAAV
jgi:single-stranded DNA-binding protein